jgi:hypothetical protein
MMIDIVSYAAEQSMPLELVANFSDPLFKVGALIDCKDQRDGWYLAEVL